MSVETWGLLPKSQIDDEYIEEAIARMIQEHDDDPDAHLDTGQSLQSHRFDEILDHKLGSVLADKFSHREDIIQLYFNTLDGWSKNAAASLSEFCSVQMFSANDENPAGYLRGTINSGGNWLDYSKDMLIQCPLWVEGEGAYRFKFGLGGLSSVSSFQGFGFQIEGDELRGYWKEGTTDLTTGVISAPIYPMTIMRAQYVAAEEKVDFYVNSEYVATLTADVSTFPFEEYEPTLGFVTGGSGTFYVSALMRSVMASRRVD